MGSRPVAEVVALCTDAARLMRGSFVPADGAGAFASCGRFLGLTAESAMAAGDVDASGGAAPSVVSPGR